MTKRAVLPWILSLLLIGTLSSCGSPRPDILTTTTILADVARNVAGDELVTQSLLPFGADPHSYQPVPQDTKKVNEAKVLIVNGAGYERSLETLLANAGNKQEVIEVSTSLRLLTDPNNDQEVDPHLWLDPSNVIVYVDNIREGLTQFNPDGADLYQANARTYTTQLHELDAWINGQVAQIPPKRRVLVTNHEALGYFAERYGFTVVGAIIESFSSDASPSAQQMADIVDRVKLFEVPAIFLDAPDNPALAQQIASETGVKVVTDLHLESLTEGAPAGTYIDMMRYNVTKIVEALK
ncbi:MAG TPA: metal ABC transporter substrate-binding protein [Anaerolineales bacterium]|nr:metal ABC transporter substrate-binding protein [Anaerolineales bacterium]